MSIVVPCSCGQQLAATPEMRGRLIACPRCGRMLTVGSSAGTASAGSSMAGTKALVIVGIGAGAVVAIGVIAVVASFAFSSRKPDPVASAPATTTATPSPATPTPAATGAPATPAPSTAVTPSPAQSAAPARSLANVEPDIRINAMDLALEWEAGPAAADAKYTGKVIEVEGAVTEYGGKNYFENKDIDKYFIKVGKTEVLFKDVRCETAETDLRTKIAKKSAVKVKGLWLPVPPPDTRIGVPHNSTRDRCTLVNCVFTEIGPNPRVTLTAEQMAAEARTDRQQFDARYGDRSTEITVSGEVASMKDDNYVLIVIKTSAPPRIVFMMVGNKDENMAFAKSKLLPGTKVRIESTYNNEYTRGDTSDILLQGSIFPEQ